MKRSTFYIHLHLGRVGRDLYLVSPDALWESRSVICTLQKKQGFRTKHQSLQDLKGDVSSKPENRCGLTKLHCGAAVIVANFMKSGTMSDAKIRTVRIDLVELGTIEDIAITAAQDQGLD